MEGGKAKVDASQGSLPVWRHLGWIEWKRSFSFDRPGGGAGNRDFWWLSVLLTLTLLLVLFLRGVQDGIIVQLMNVSFGHVEDHGTPIWASSRTANPDNPGFDARTIERIEQIGSPPVSVYVYQQVDEMIRLPVLKSSSAGGIWAGPRFKGRAVRSLDPLWPSPQGEVKATNVPLPLEIVLNRSLFLQSFDCAAYVEAVRQYRPGFDPPSDDDGKLSCLSDNVIFLETKVGAELHELHGFHVRWSDHVSSIGKIAFLAPMRLFAALRLVRANGNLSYYPEFVGNLGERVKALRLWGAPSREEQKKLVECLKAPEGVETSSGRISFDKPIMMDLIDHCAQWSGIAFRRPGSAVDASARGGGLLTIDERVTQRESDVFVVSDETFEVACDQLVTNWQRKTDCEKGKRITLGLKDIFWSFSSAIIYTRERLSILDTVDRVEGLRLETEECASEVEGATDSDGAREVSRDALDRCQAVYIQGLYKDALMRFEFLDRILSMLGSYLKWFFLVFFLVLMVIQVGMMILHRRHNYAVLLAKGWSFSELRKMVVMQVGLCVVFATLFATFLLQVLRYFVGRGLDRILSSDRFSGQISRQLDFIDVSLMAWGLTVIVALLLSWLIAVARLRRLCPKDGGEPCEILYS